jgi:hypothetical protein
MFIRNTFANTDTRPEKTQKPRMKSEFMSSIPNSVRDESGASVVVFSLMAPVMLGFVGLGVEVGSWYLQDRHLQSVADASALAGAIDRAYSIQSGDLSPGGALSAANDQVLLNGLDPASLAQLQINTPPTSGTLAGDDNAVEVVLGRALPRTFSGLFTTGDVEISARSVARTKLDGRYCILATHPDDSGAITFSGSSMVNLDCGIASNSTAADAILSSGSTQATVTAMRAVGGIDNNGGLVSTGPTISNSNPVLDPYTDLELPPIQGCDHNNRRAGDGEILSPGVYCGGLRVNSQSAVTLLPGTYVMDDGDLTINAGAMVSGSDITFAMAGTSGRHGQVSINGTATVNLDAPNAGTYAGVLLLHDPDTEMCGKGHSSTYKFNGTAGSTLEGLIYAPTKAIEMSGNAAVANGCIQIVASTITFTGNVTTTTICDDPIYRKVGGVVATLAE